MDLSCSIFLNKITEAYVLSGIRKEMFWLHI